MAADASPLDVSGRIKTSVSSLVRWRKRPEESPENATIWDVGHLLDVRYYILKSLVGLST
jgi:hypothetical protein